jgi:hypothetical protein
MSASSPRLGSRLADEGRSFERDVGRRSLMRRGSALAVVAAVFLAIPSGASACGHWRWPVKTLQDSRAGRVSFATKSTTIAQLAKLTPPSTLGARTLRTGPVETTVWRVDVDLVAFKFESDQDVHLVVQDKQGRTMIAEFPDPGCTTGASPTVRAKMSSARNALLKACGKPGKLRFVTLSGPAQLDGVGFFDDLHGQNGVAPNGIELHPVVRFSAIQCRRTGTRRDRHPAD